LSKRKSNLLVIVAFLAMTAPAVAAETAPSASETTPATGPAAAPGEAQADSPQPDPTAAAPATASSAEPANPPAEDTDGTIELQKKLANPVADLISLPFQYTATANVGPEPNKSWQHVLNFQPVYPVKLGGVHLINRAIVPLMSNPEMVPGSDRKSGLGDILYEGFISPAKPLGGMIVGVGPILSLPTATDDMLGSNRFSLGPAVVLLAQPGALTVGALITQMWSFHENDGRREVAFGQIQPILTYRLDPLHTIGYAGIITADWKSDSSQRYTVPLGVTLSQLVKPAGFTPINFIGGGGYNVVRPDTGGDWFLRLQINFVLPA
jgi:hypothetical protein